MKKLLTILLLFPALCFSQISGDINGKISGSIQSSMQSKGFGGEDPPPPPEIGQIYYVSTSGSDVSGNGTQTYPWKTISYAESQCVTPGDTIALKRGDTFILTTRVRFDQQGSYGLPIIWDGLLWGSGDTAIVTAATAIYCMFDVHDADYLTFQNIEFQGQSVNNSAIIIGGYYTQDSAQTNITVQDCNFHNIGNASGNSIFAILVTPYDYPYDTITIQRNYISGVAQCGISVYSGRSDLGALPTEAKNIYIGYNEIYNYSLNLTGEALGINNKVTNCIIEYNIAMPGPGTSYGLGLVIGQNESAYGIYPPNLGYFPTGIIVRYNDIRTYDQPAVYIQGGQAFEVAFYYNKFYREIVETSIGRGVVMIIDEYALGYSGADFDLYNNDIVLGTGDGYCLGKLITTLNVWDIKNNIFINAGNSVVRGLIYSSSTISSHSNNNFYRTLTGDPIYVYINNPYASLDSSDVVGWEGTAIVDNPDLVNLAGFDWHLQVGSPCINTGVNIPTIPQFDYDGVAVSDPPEIGAFEK